MLEQLSLFRNIGSCWTNACSGHSYWNETKNYSRFKSLDSLLISQAQDLLLGIAFSVPLSQNLALPAYVRAVHTSRKAPHAYF